MDRTNDIPLSFSELLSQMEYVCYPPLFAELRIEHIWVEIGVFNYFVHFEFHPDDAPLAMVAFDDGDYKYIMDDNELDADAVEWVLR